MSGRVDDPSENGGLEPPTDEMLAGEYVLGVLDTASRRQLQARLATDAAFARLVGQWEQDLHPLLAEVTETEVPDAVWGGIRNRLGWAVPQAERSGFWWNVGFWRGATALTATVAIAAIVIGRAPFAPLPAPPPVAEEQAAKPVTTLARDDGQPAWLASVDVSQGTVLMVPVPAPADGQGRIPELWLIEPGQAAKSLGLLAIDKSHTVAVPPALRQGLAAGSTLAVTLEPQGGAPQGLPTGPIIAKGAIRLS